VEGHDDRARTTTKLKLNDDILQRVRDNNSRYGRFLWSITDEHQQVERSACGVCVEGAVRGGLTQPLELLGENAATYVDEIRSLFEPSMEPGLPRIAQGMAESR
jgi:hypothetical protein